MQEKEKALRYFFRHLMIYVAINGLCLLIWLLSGLGYFWPFWPIVFAGIPLFIEALRLGILPKTCQERTEKLFNSIPHVTANYEDKFVNSCGNKDKKATPKKATPKKATPKKPAAKKSAAKKK